MEAAELMRYLLDTVVFNRLLDGGLLLEDLPQPGEYLATPIQIAELGGTPDGPRRERLLNTFRSVDPSLVPATFSLDVAGAGLDEGVWGDGEWATRLQNVMDRLQPRRRHLEDALITEAAVRHEAILVTADRILAIAAEEVGVRVHRIP